jgi:hypothetical protein
MTSKATRFILLRNEFTHILMMEYDRKQKMTGKCIIAQRKWQFPLFFRGDISITKQNK